MESVRNVDGYSHQKEERRTPVISKLESDGKSRNKKGIECSKVII
tara:strand:+ start:1371 stop:1505 length:135 start_codon:yes stop_codon:yes gene_type:complete